MAAMGSCRLRSLATLRCLWDAACGGSAMQCVVCVALCVVWQQRALVGSGCGRYCEVCVRGRVSVHMFERAGVYFRFFVCVGERELERERKQERE